MNDEQLNAMHHLLTAALAIVVKAREPMMNASSMDGVRKGDWLTPERLKKAQQMAAAGFSNRQIRNT
jgi:hypothetical protein